MSKNIVDYTCYRCGGHRIVHDCTARYNSSTGEYEIIDILDSSFCEDCEDECKVDFGEVEENDELD